MAGNPSNPSNPFNPYNPYKAQHNAYKTTSIQTAGQGRLVCLLFEGAIKFMNQFIEAVNGGQIERAHENSMKSQRIITELILSLDHSKGGEVSRVIEAAYDDIRNRMTMSNIRKDVAIAETVLADLQMFLETWTKVFKTVEIEPQAQSAQSGVSIKT